VTRGLLRRNWKIPGIELAHSRRVSCQYLAAIARSTDSPQVQPKVYVEADGELVGTLPAEITMVPDALTLLAPTR
jgi:diacylglycerol kinase family enzyme